MTPFNARLSVAVLATALTLSACSDGGRSTKPADSGPSSSASASSSSSAGGSDSGTLRVAATPTGQDRDGHDGLTPATATFAPPSPGDPARIEAEVGGAWKTLATGKQDRTGRLVAQVDLGEGQAPEVRAVSGAATSAPVRPRSKDLLWSDDFDGSSLDRSKWGYRVQGATGLRQCSMPVEGLVKVRRGHAVLRVEQVGGPTKACPDGLFHNAMIATSTASTPFAATYGTFAARVRFQSTQGMHGSFWLQGDGAKNAEIDVAEYFGDGRKDLGLSSFVHHANAAGKTLTSGGTHDYRRIMGQGNGPANDWHVYSVEWTRRGYVFLIDGQEIFRTDKPIVASDPEYLILSLLTSDYELPRLVDPKATMKVDWVRVWQK